MSCEKVLVLQALCFCVFKVTESVFNCKKMIFNAFNFTALVYKADNRFCENVRCIDNIACNSAFVLLGNCKIINSESVINLAVRVCNCFSEHFKRVARHKNYLAAVDVFNKKILVLFKILQNKLLIFFCTRTDVDKIVIAEVGIVKQGKPVGCKFYTALIKHSFECGNIGIFSVQVHYIVIQMKNFHNQSTFTFSRNLPLSEKQVIT